MPLNFRFRKLHHLVLKRNEVFQVHGLGNDMEEAKAQHPQALRPDLHTIMIMMRYGYRYDPERKQGDWIDGVWNSKERSRRWRYVQERERVSELDMGHGT